MIKATKQTLHTLYYLGLGIFTGITLGICLQSSSLATPSMPTKTINIEDSIKTIISPVLDTSKIMVCIVQDSVVSSAYADSVAYSELSNRITAYDSLIEEALYFSGQYYELATKYLVSGDKSSYERFIYVSDSFIGDANKLEDNQRIVVNKIANFKQGLYGTRPHQIKFKWKGKKIGSTYSEFKYDEIVILGNQFTIIKR